MPTGKWTTYRSMACDTVDRAIKVAGLKDTKGCQTDGLLLEGAQNWYPTLFIRLIQDHGLDVEVKMKGDWWGASTKIVKQFANILKLVLLQVWGGKVVSALQFKGANQSLCIHFHNYLRGYSIMIVFWRALKSTNLWGTRCGVSM